MPAIDQQKIQIGQGDIWVGGTAPAAGSDPLDPTSSTVNTMTTGFNAPASGGTYVGATNGAATLTYRPTYYNVVTEQAFADVVTIPTAEETTLAFNALEMTYQNIQTALSQSTTLAGGAAGNVNFVGSKPGVTTAVVVLCSRKRTGTGYFLLTIYQGYSSEGVAINFERRAESRLPVTIRALADLSRPEGDQLFQLAEFPSNPA